MLSEKRLQKIKKYLEEQQTVSIEELVALLNVSKDTIRRDLMKLEGQNVAKRIRGGAKLISREALIFDYEERSNQKQKIKERIADRAVERIPDNVSLMLDSSTTVEALISLLDGKGLLTITNSLTHARLLAQLENCEVCILPGKLHKKQLFIYGAETVNKMRDYQVDYSVIGVFAINKEGLFIHTEEEGLVKRQMIQQGKQVMALADDSKIETTGFFKVCGLAEIDILVTNQQPSADFLEELSRNNVELLLI